MRLLYDLASTQPLDGSKYHGGGEYGKIIFNELIKKTRAEDISVFYLKDQFIDPLIENNIVKNKIKCYRLNNMKEIEDIIKKEKIDRLFSPLPLRLKDIDLSGTEFIFTIHGLRFLELYKDKYEYKYFKKPADLAKYMIKRLIPRKVYENLRKKELSNIFDKKNSIVLTDSVHSKYSIINEFPKIKQKNIFVFYAPNTFENNEIQSAPLNIDVKEKDFFLIVNANRWIKNSYRALKALQSVKNKFGLKNKKTVLVGDINENLKRELKKIDGISVKNLRRNEMDYLYKNAYSLIYPTLNEGFGYPPVEAMRYGVPVIGSAVTSITEIYGESILYFNPYSIKEIENRILQVLFDDKKYLELSDYSRIYFQKVLEKQEEDLNKLINFLVEKR